MHARTAVFVANRAFGLAVSRVPLLRALHERGVRTVAVCAADEHAPALSAVGCTVVDAPVVRGALNPLADLRFARTLRQVFRAERPALVHLFNAKPVIIGAPCARPHAGVVVATITGLGHAFIHGRLTRFVAGRGYQRALAMCDAAIFQNDDDRALFDHEGWKCGGQTVLIRGSGVELARFDAAWHARAAATGLRDAPGKRAPTVLMAARLLRQKGVLEFAEAARQVRQRRPEVRFVLAGERDAAHPDALSDGELAQLREGGAVEYIGWQPMAELLADADLLVAASYREGMPRVVLEAAACGVPSVVADVAGCREAVDPNRTGVVVPPRDAAALAGAIEQLLSDPPRAAAMGRAARERVEREFRSELIVERHLQLYAQLGATL